jgi:hypothetical protein
VLLCWDAESLELRIVEALTAAYPKPLNGAQLAKLCGHFKLKSKVSQLLVFFFNCWWHFGGKMVRMQTPLGALLQDMLFTVLPVTDAWLM